MRRVILVVNALFVLLRADVLVDPPIEEDTDVIPLCMSGSVPGL